MARLPLMAAVALALVASPALFCATTTPASAQEWSDRDGGIGEGNLRDFLRDALQARRDRRDMLMDLLQERRDRRSELLDLIRERRDLRGDLIDMIGDRGDRGDLRERLRERIGERLGEGGLRGRLRERIAERLGAGEEGNCYFLTRSLRNEDGSLLVIVRRRVCRD